MSSGLPLVRLEGGPRDWGEQHGRAAKDRVAHNVRAYLKRFAEDGKLAAKEIRDRAEQFRQVIGRMSPGYALAVDGIAEGAGQDVLDVVAVNVRYELMYSDFARAGMERERGPSALGGCTSFAVLPERSANGHLLLGQNWDWIPEARGIVLDARGDDGTRILAFTEAGIAGAKIGLNGAGVALAINGLLSNEDTWSLLRKPFHVRCWEVLHSKDLAGALEAVEGTRPACSGNFLLGVAGEHPQVVDVEAAPAGTCTLTPSDGVLAHTNHFLDPDALGIWQPLAGDRDSTLRRYERMHAMLREATAGGGTIGVVELKGMLADHANGVLSVCRHQDPARPPNERFETVVSVVMDVDAREMHLAAGMPCTAPYRTYALA